MSPPLVYCETNWLVALAFPHHEHYERAQDLLKRAKAGDCRLRIPVAALLEAKNPIAEVGGQLARTFAALRDDLARAVRNGTSGLAPLASTFQASRDVDAYSQRKALSVIEEVKNEPSVAVLDDVQSSILVMHELRLKVELRGKDAVDLYLLAAIVHDRRQSPVGPAIFFSTNLKEFDPKKAKVPASVYESERLLWQKDFDLSSAVGAWTAKYP